MLWILVLKATPAHINAFEQKIVFQPFFPECVAGVPVSFGGLGVRPCSRKVVSVSATVRNRPQPFA